MKNLCDVGKPRGMCGSRATEVTSPGAAGQVGGLEWRWERESRERGLARPAWSQRLRVLREPRESSRPFGAGIGRACSWLGDGPQTGRGLVPGLTWLQVKYVAHFHPAQWTRAPSAEQPCSPPALRCAVGCCGKEDGVSCPYNSFSLNFSGERAAKMNDCRLEPEQLQQGWKLPLRGCGQSAGCSTGIVVKCTSALAEFLLCSLQDGEFLSARPVTRHSSVLFPCS